MIPPTDKELEVYDFIEDYINGYGRAPSWNEIRDGLEMSSNNSVQYYINQLISKGLLVKTKAKTRNLALKKI